MRANPKLTSALGAGSLLFATCVIGAGAASAASSTGNGAGVFDGNSAKITNPYLLITKSIHYFAQDKAGKVYYFGEDVNEYRPHKPASHEGQWRLGRDTNTPGILMPAHPKLGDSYKAEAVPGITHETDHVVAVGKT